MNNFCTTLKTKPKKRKIIRKKTCLVERNLFEVKSHNFFKMKKVVVLFLFFYDEKNEKKKFTQIKFYTKWKIKMNTDRRLSSLI